MNARRYGKPETLYKQTRVDRIQGIDTIGQYEKLGKITNLGRAEHLGITESWFLRNSSSPVFPKPTT